MGRKVASRGKIQMRRGKRDTLGGRGNRGDCVSGDGDAAASANLTREKYINSSELKKGPRKNFESDFVKHV